MEPTTELVTEQVTEQAGSNVVSVFLGSAGQEPDVPAPRVSDANPLSGPTSGLPEMRFFENEGFLFAVW
ncbi:hypothetical protein LN040_11260 [Desulfovibrio subterraneus]|uniref:hypothetical protein n=1 Tax=Desulfovibrio subterraneus TaxID=2718620 RepID=UPI0022B92479|nr:hypothetical protein [Desulfovibrio subterraneus]WBF66307.1 hypothetical protein LN040_11260 [Desulfovibrio subterraneus]